MKKLILSAALLAGMTFVACSDDSDGNTGTNCVPCILELTDEVCETSSGTAIVDGIDSLMPYDEFVAAYCGNTGPGPNPNPSENCVTCAATDEMPMTLEICEGDNGNAVFMDQDTGVEYDAFIQAYETQAGTTCE